MWVIDESPGTLVNEWHKTYSVVPTKVLGKLACIVTSKVLGIGSSERNWKIVKHVKNGQRTNTDTIKCEKQELIYGIIMQKKDRCKQEKLSSVGKL